MKRILLLLIILLSLKTHSQFLIPTAVNDRSNTNSIELTKIGKFGEIRKARPNVPKHLHTGIDIKRPYKNYNDEPIFPVYEGTVVSIRTDGAYAQIIISHKYNGIYFWSVYEHVAGVECEINEYVYPDSPIARFMNTNELNKYGWQFDHVHLEIMKTPPVKIKPNQKTPFRHYSTHWLSCFNTHDLNKYYYNPFSFFTEGIE